MSGYSQPWKHVPTALDHLVELDHRGTVAMNLSKEALKVSKLVKNLHVFGKKVS
jgi:hypothetical protein